MIARSAVLLSILLASGCASTGAVPRPFPTPGGGATGGTVPTTPGDPTPRDPTPRDTPPRDTTPRTLPADGYSISSTALSLRGAPYRNGGTDPSGFDCSGFVRYVFAQHGVSLPRDVRQQFEKGQQVPASAIEAGDLLFFTTVAPGASHVGIAVGGDQFIHAPSTNGVVRVENLSSQYWGSRFVGAKRVN